MWISSQLSMRNTSEITNWLTSIQYILKIYKQHIIFFITIVIRKILRLQVYFIIAISLIKMKLFCDKNLVILKSIHTKFVGIFIYKMNFLIELILQLLTISIRYIYLDSTSQITTAPIIRYFFIEIHKFAARPLTDPASIWQICFSLGWFY